MRCPALAAWRLSPRFVQAAIAATPIASLEADPNGLLEAREIGYCAHGDLDALVAWIGSALADEDRLRDMGARAFAYARETHDENRVIEAFKRMVREVAVARG